MLILIFETKPATLCKTRHGMYGFETDGVEEWGKPIGMCILPKSYVYKVSLQNVTWLSNNFIEQGKKNHEVNNQRWNKIESGSFGPSP